MDTDTILSLVTAFFLSWQVKALAGLIVVDIFLGIASALRRGVFNWPALAKFYSTMILPYILGYLAFYVAVGFIIPPDSLGEMGDVVNQATVTLAWVALVGALISSIKSNFSLLYQQPPA